MLLRLVFNLLVLVVISSSLFTTSPGQTPEVEASDRQNKTSDQNTKPEDVFISNLIFEARSQTPEIAADALITIAESGKIRSRKLHRQILEEAFALADQAQYPAMIRYTGYAHTPAFFIYYGLELKLDKLALRSRVINALLKFDKFRARKLFLNEMPQELDLPSLGCENAVRYYDVNYYYETASAVFSETFSAKERAEPAFFYTVLPFIDRMSSPAQVNPIAKMLVGLNLKPAQLSLFAASYAQALARVRNDDFTFRAWISEYSGIKNLSIALGESGIGQPQIINAFREYVVRQLNSTRCSDGIKKNLKDPLAPKYERPVYVQNLNDALFKEKPIGADEIDPANIVKTTKPPYYWDPPRSAARWEDCGSLVYKQTGSAVYSDEEKGKPEWQAALDRYLLDHGMWEASEESSPEDFVIKKSIIFTRLLQEVVPKGPVWAALLKEYVLFLSRNELRGDARLQWLVLARTAIVNLLLKNLKGEERAKMITLTRGLKNSTINLYLDLMELKDQDQKPSNED